MQKILAIATNANPLLHGKPTGLWLSELTHFLDVVEQAGYGYDVASPLGGKIPIDERRKNLDAQIRSDSVNARFMAKPSFRSQLEASLACGEIEPHGYAALYLAGGHGTMFDFRSSAPLQRVISQMHAAKAPLSGVCHGVSGFVDSVDSQGNVIVHGKRITGFSNFEDTLDGSKKLLPFLLEDALKEQGAHYKKNLIPFTSRVETDSGLITGQNPQSARDVGVKVLQALQATRAR